METINLSGTWQCAIPGMEKPIRIPGTLDESGIGYKDVGGKKWHPDTDTSREIYQVDQGIRTRLTRVVTYEGPASITRTLTWDGGQASFDAILLSTGADPAPQWQPGAGLDRRFRKHALGV